MTLPKGTYEMVETNGAKESTCQIEVCIDHSKIAYHRELEKEVPLRILCFSIKTNLSFQKLSAKNQFSKSDPETDPVIQISTMVQVQNEACPFIRKVFMVGDSDPIAGVDLVNCNNEKDLLLMWRNFIEDTDPDVITGYIPWVKEFQYLLRRAEFWGILTKKFSILSRVKSVETSVMQGNVTEGGYLISKDYNFEGRVMLDVFKYLEGEKKRKGQYSEKLDMGTSAKKYLDEERQPLTAKEVFLLHMKNSSSRRKLVLHCLKDTHLSLRIFQNSGCFQYYLDESIGTCVPVDHSFRWRIYLMNPKYHEHFKVFMQNSDTGLLEPNLPNSSEPENGRRI